MRKGEPTFPISTREALQVLQREAEAMSGNDIDAARDFLIKCGQFEQGYRDAAIEENLAEFRRKAQPLTEIAAQGFLEIFKGENGEAFFQAFAEESRRFNKDPDLNLYLRVPRAFALHGVFPEALILATEDLTSTHYGLRGHTWLILGNRVGGTALTALVRAVMVRSGMQCHRRTVEFDSDAAQFPISMDLAPCQDAVIVDDGSGEHLAELTELAFAAGARGNICWVTTLPIASQAVSDKPLGKSMETESFCARAEELRWQGKTLPETLAAHSERLLGEACSSIHDFSGGGWREMVWVDPRLWPPVMPWSLPKFLCRTASGKGLLWKFSGFGSGADFATRLVDEGWNRVEELAEKSWTVPPAAKKRGFIAFPWLPGQRLTSRDIDYPLLNHLANYLFASALPPIGVAKATEQFHRLQQVILQAISDCVPDGKAATVTEFLNQTEPPVQLPTSGDGSLAPHKWIRTESGNILKLDCAGHLLGPTGLGQQSILWDLAGLIVEWDLPGSAQVQLQVQFANAQMPFTRENLSLYLLAYTAWKISRHDLSLRIITNDPPEAKRHRHARETLRRQLERFATSLPMGK